MKKFCFFVSKNFKVKTDGYLNRYKIYKEQLMTARKLAESLDKTVNHLKEENFNLQSKLRVGNQRNAPTVVDINSRKG
jgi:hypothetical protein